MPSPPIATDSEWTIPAIMNHKRNGVINAKTIEEIVIIDWIDDGIFGMPWKTIVILYDCRYAAIETSAAYIPTIITASSIIGSWAMLFIVFWGFDMVPLILSIKFIMISKKPQRAWRILANICAFCCRLGLLSSLFFSPHLYHFPFIRVNKR